MIQAQLLGTYPGLTPHSFARLPMRTVKSLMRHAQRVHLTRAWPEAQTAFMVARTMGGYKGTDLDPFLPPWAKPHAEKRALVSAAVDKSIRAGLSLGLVSQEALDLLIEYGFEP